MIIINIYSHNILSIYSHNELGKIIHLIDFPYAIIKGEALSIQSYGLPLQRSNYDIDILVDRKNAKKLYLLLLNNGFETRIIDRKNEVMLFSSSHQLPTVEKQIEGIGCITIDINFDIFWGEYTGKRINIDNFLNDVQPLKIFNHTFNTLSVKKAFVQMCLHHYKEMNSIYVLSKHNTIRKDMFADIYYLIKNNLSDLYITNIKQLIEEYSISQYVYYMLYYTKHIFNDPILENYVDAFDCEKGRKLLNLYGLSKKEQKKWKITFEERLNSNNLYNVIQNDLTDYDLRKINSNQTIFGPSNLTQGNI